jgi:uncharacterized protein (TIGR04222 family)
VIAALTSLVRSECLEIRSNPNRPRQSKLPDRIVAKGPLPANAPEIERRIYEAVADSGQTLGASVSSIFSAGRGATDNYLSRLQEAGLVQPNPCEPGIRRYLPSIIMAVIAVFGVIKICVGVARERPVGYLVTLTIVAVVMAVLFWIRSRRSPAGNRSLKQLRDKYAGLRTSALTAAGEANADFVCVVGLFGMAALAGHPLYDDLFHSLQRQKLLTTDGAVADATSSGGCGAAGCGAGGGCGGGGCGGGCGGCGG